MSAPPPRSEGFRRSGLFLRIYLAFVLTVVAFAVAAGGAMYSLAKSYDADWVAKTVDTVTEHNDAIWAARDDPEQLHRAVGELEDALEARVHLLPRGHHRTEAFAGLPHHPPPSHHRLDRRQRRMLKHGRPIVHPRGPLRPPVVIWRLLDPETEAMTALVVVDTPHGSKRGIVIIGLVVGLGVLGGGAWVLARSLTGRLATLERDTMLFAGGDLAHRSGLADDAPRDEIDQLAVAFNDMAGKIESLLNGQRTLLANVSHELRTPIARMRVLAEILQERIENAGRPDDPNLQRIDKGLVEMNEDLAEVEVLINDLLTSGRLELGRDGVLQRGPIRVTSFLDRLARRFDATVGCDPADLELEADQLLLERLLSNLLANARRACPDGTVSLGCVAEGDTVVFSVEDEGPGIPPEEREIVFEPFARLDGARDRDRGGVGLGLHLCRQIAQAHGGTIRAEGRRDGKRGARMVVRIPRA